MEGKKVPVGMRALTQRINRALAKDGQKLVTSRSNMEKSNFGNWYIVDISTNAVDAYHCELETLAKECGVLKPYEVFED